MAELETALLVLLVGSQAALVGSQVAIAIKVWDCNKRVKRIEKVVVIEEIPRLVSSTHTQNQATKPLTRTRTKGKS